MATACSDQLVYAGANAQLPSEAYNTTSTNGACCVCYRPPASCPRAPLITDEISTVLTMCPLLMQVWRTERAAPVVAASLEQLFAEPALLPTLAACLAEPALLPALADEAALLLGGYPGPWPGWCTLPS